MRIGLTYSRMGIQNLQNKEKKVKKKLLASVGLAMFVVGIATPIVSALDNNQAKTGKALVVEAQKLEDKAPKGLPKKTLPKNKAVKGE